MATRTKRGGTNYSTSDPVTDPASDPATATTPYTPPPIDPNVNANWPGSWGPQPTNVPYENPPPPAPLDLPGGSGDVTTSVTSRGPEIDAEALDVIRDASAYANQPFQLYPDQRIADLSDPENAAIQGSMQLGNEDYNLPEAYDWTKDAALAGPSSIDQLGRIIDESGVLGNISDYMNPYLQESLNPAIRELNEQYQRQLNQLGGQAASAGAYGDARHGVMEGLTNENLMQTIGDLVYGANRDAFNTAMGLRGADLSRMGQENQFNAGAQETQYGRMTQGAQQIAKLGEATLNNKIKEINAQMQAGAITRQQAQDELDFMFSEFMRYQDEPIKDINLRIAATSGVPVSSSSTTKQSEPAQAGSEGLLGLVGGLINSIF